MMIPFSRKKSWKVEELFLEDEKLVFTLKSFLTVGSFFDAEASAHYSMCCVARILGKKVADVCFTFKVDTLLDAEGLGDVK